MTFIARWKLQTKLSSWRKLSLVAVKVGGHYGQVVAMAGFTVVDVVVESTFAAFAKPASFGVQNGLARRVSTL